MDIFGPCLPLSSMRLFVPPLRLVSATLWQTIERGDVGDYGLLEEFVTGVLGVIPDLMSYRDKVQLLMGLRARLLLEGCHPDHPGDPETIQQHLNKMKTCSIIHRKEESSDPEVETSESHFLRLIETLLGDPAQTEHFFQKVFPEEFGPKYDFALQTLVWEFLSRLDTLIPTPTLKQMASILHPAPSALEELVQSVCHLEPLRTLLLNHNTLNGYFDPNGLSSDDNFILCTLSLILQKTADNFAVQADPEVQSEPVQKSLGIPSPASSDNQSEMPFWSESSHTEETLGVNAVQTGPSSPEMDPEDTLEREDENTAVDRESAKEGDLDFQCPQTHRGLEASRKTFKQEPLDVSSVVTACLLHQPQVGLYRLDVTDELLSGASSSLPVKRRRERVQIEEEGCHSQRRGTVIIQKRKMDFSQETLVVSHPEESRGQGPKGPDGVDPLDGECHKSPSTTTSSTLKVSTAGNEHDETCSLGKNAEQSADAELVSGTSSSTPKLRRNRRREKRRIEKVGRQGQRTGKVVSQKREKDHVTKKQGRGQLPDTAREDSSNTKKVSIAGSKGVKKCSLCGQTFSQAMAFATHLSSHAELTAKATCRVCNKIFSSPHRMKGHLLSRHGELLYQCLDCGESFKKKVDSDKHRKGCKIRFYSCSDCGKKFDPSEPALTNVSRKPCRIGLGKDFKTCLLCNETFDDAHHLAEHLKLQHNLKPYPCLHCGQSFQTVSKQKEHLRNCASQKKCPSCRKANSQSTQETNLDRQQPDLPKTSVENNMEISQSCSSGVELSEKLQQQQSDTGEEITSPSQQQDSDEAGVRPNQHPGDRSMSLAIKESGTEVPQPHTSTSSATSNSGPAPSPPPGVVLDNRTCPQCFKSFAKSDYMKQHLRLSHATGPYSCTICSRFFGRLSDLTKHHALKTGCGPNRRNRISAPVGDTASFRCSHCNALFKTEKKLRNHMVYHTGEGFSCKYCGKMFNNKTSVNLHLRSHVDRRHLCETCGKGFATVNTLRIHMQSHSDERPFICTECGKCYKSKGMLQVHHRVHSGERPFPCSVCQVRCTTQSGLRKHMMTHNRETYFKCEKCGKSYTQKSYLKFHACSPTPVSTL